MRTIKLLFCISALSFAFGQLKAQKIVNNAEFFFANNQSASFVKITRYATQPNLGYISKLHQ